MTELPEPLALRDLKALPGLRVLLDLRALWEFRASPEIRDPPGLPEPRARQAPPVLLLRQYMHNTEIAVTMRLSTILKTIKQPL